VIVRGAGTPNHRLHHIQKIHPTLSRAGLDDVATWAPHQFQSRSVLAFTLEVNGDIL
jgi:hypothetical protein